MAPQQKRQLDAAMQKLGRMLRAVDLVVVGLRIDPDKASYVTYRAGISQMAAHTRNLQSAIADFVATALHTDGTLCPDGLRDLADDTEENAPACDCGDLIDVEPLGNA